MEAFAASMQKVTVLGDEAVLELASLGASLGKLSGQALKDATKAAIGLSAALGIDAISAMRLVSRAAIGDTATLARYGIKLSETLSPQEKFNELLRIGAQSFSLAEGQAKTFSGQVAQLGNAWGDVKEKIGEALMPVAMAFIEAMRTNLPLIQEKVVGVAKAFAEWFEERGGAARLIADLEAIVKAMRDAVTAMRDFHEWSGFGKMPAKSPRLRADEGEPLSPTEAAAWERFNRLKAAPELSLGAELKPRQMKLDPAASRMIRAREEGRLSFDELHAQLAAKRGMGEGPVQEFGGLGRQVEAHVKKLNEGLKEAAAIRRAMETPVEMFKRERERLEQLRELGVLGEGDFRRALDKSFQEAREKAQAAQPREMEFAVVQTVQEALALAAKPDPIQTKQLAALDKIAENTAVPRVQTGGLE